MSEQPSPPQAPQPPIPARVLIIMFVLFFVLPGLCCMGCISFASLFPTAAERAK